MAPTAKRRKVECLLCHKTFDSDYRSRHNKKYHTENIKKRIQIPYKIADAPANPFQVACSRSSDLSTPQSQESFASTHPNHESNPSTSSGPQAAETIYETDEGNPNVECSLPNIHDVGDDDAVLPVDECVAGTTGSVMTLLENWKDCLEEHVTAVGTFPNPKLSDLSVLTKESDLIDTSNACDVDVFAWHSDSDHSDEISTGSTAKEKESFADGEEIQENLEKTGNTPNETDTHDPVTYIGKVKELDPALRKQLILKGAFQPKANEMTRKQFPKSRCGSHDRCFNESWYQIVVGKNTFKRKWLSYSSTNDAVFCHFCIFFCDNNKEETFTKSGYRDWRKASEKLAKHEQSQCHINATVDFTHFCSRTSISEQLSEKSARMATARQEKVRKNREIIKRLIDITLFLAQQGIAFRGHREDSSTTEEVARTGNFLAVIDLLAKYDEGLATHLREVDNSKLKRTKTKTKGEKSKSGRGNLVSFMSADSQNKIINSIGDQLLKVIVDEIKAAGMYSIAMDCTTDSAHADQLSIIIRYLNKSLDIVERLVCIERVTDSSAKGLFNTLQEILNKSAISLSDAVGQSYDGASVMTGKYKGVKTLVQEVNPQCLFIWTFDHVLNLVIMEACGSSLASKSLFGVLEKLYAFFSQSRKRSDILEEKQKESNIQQIHRPQRVSTTRWWSHQKALNNVYFAQDGSLFDCFLDTLQECQSPSQSRETITDAEALEKKLMSFETVITAYVFNEIFAITDPASLYLQSENIDLLTAIRLVETAESHLTTLRDEFNKVHALAKAFCVEHELEQRDFVEKRVRRRKRLAGELCNDEIEEDQTNRFRRETFIHAIDTAIISTTERFSSHKAILADFSFLDPERFQYIITSGSLPADAFQNVARNYNLDNRKLKNEYMSFIDSYPKLKETVNDVAPTPNENNNKDIERESYINVLKVLSKFDLQCAFPQLYSLYKTLVTLPIGSTKCERTFSKLKFVKNRLRSTMGQQRLNYLMLIHIERELTKFLNYEELINTFASTPLLRKLLQY